ncbi:hypothetical protein Patl1_13104 [Pistacia atlantica]|uniref:Uncharacterized protein n=1 Tax=Pistacia atlantica TaxID=434234 RepID=A0ACC1AS70_9ROSI|nr:hypothetical protein Patl1_13104 [Pistacia atlantica]
MRKKSPSQSLEIFRRHLQLGFLYDIDEVTIAIALKACSGDQKPGDLYYYSRGNALITLYSRWGHLVEARSVFDALPNKDLVSWNAMISGYTQEGNYGLEAIWAFIDMVREGIRLDHVSFTSAVSACGHERNLQLGRQIHGYAQNGLCQAALSTFLLASSESKPNQYTFGSVLSAIGSAEDISLKHGQRCHSHIIKLGLNTDPVVSGALLDMYAKRGSIYESQRVFSETPEKSQFAWTAIISAYARHGDYESVMNWFKKMEKEGVRPDSITFLSVLTASDMLGRAGRLKEAEELMGRSPGGPGMSMLQSLLGACRIHGNIEMGERVADVLLGMEPMGSGSYVLMSNLYAEKGDWEKVAKIRKGMREKGVKKEVGFSWVDVGDIDGLHGFSSGDKSHPRYEEICGMAESLGSEMKYLREKNRAYSK